MTQLSTIEWRDRLAAVPPAALGFVELCLLQSGLDRVDPSAGRGERFLGLVLLAFALSGLVTAVVTGVDTTVPGGIAAGLFLRGGLVLSGLLLLGQVLFRARLNPLVDVQFVVALLLLALVTAPPPYRRDDRVGALLARFAVPLGLVALLLSVPVTVAKVIALP